MGKRTEPASTVVGDGAKVGLLLLIPALVAWSTGRPFIFPSLGPSAFALVMDREEAISAGHVIGGHFFGVICGFLSFHLIASGYTVSHLPAVFSPSLFSLAMSGVVSVVMTTMATVVLRIPHPPACATTMIVSLGLLPTVADAVFIMAAIAVMYGIHRLFIATGLQRGNEK